MSPISIIRARANKLGLTTTAQIARHAGLPRKTLAGLFDSTSTIPTLQTAVQIFRVFRIRPEKWISK